MREVKDDDGIDVFAEDQIKKVTNISTQGYDDFAKQFKGAPLIVILDGHDELFRAKGDVFSGQLEKVRTSNKTRKSLIDP